MASVSVESIPRGSAFHYRCTHDDLVCIAQSDKQLTESIITGRFICPININSQALDDHLALTMAREQTSIAVYL